MDRIALVTGAAGGIGRAIATTLASRGASVIVLDMHQDSCHNVAEEIRASGGTVYEAVADVRSSQELQKVRSGLGDIADRVNVVINCAGILRTTPFLDISPDEWTLMLDTHLKGTFLVCKSFVPGMIKNGGGIIINTSSNLGIIGSPGRAHYCAAKRAIHTLTKNMATELAPYGIRAISLAPGPIDTEMLREGLSAPEYQKRLEATASRVPLGRVGRPQDVADLAAWLALGGGRFINGQLLNVDGGTVMR